MQHLDVLEQVEDAELLLANGGEGGVAKLQGALALTVHGPQVVELLRTACMASPSCHRRRPGAWRLRTSTHRRHPPCLCTCTYTAASSPHARGASTRRAARRRAQRDATRRAPLLGGTSRADRASRPAGLPTPRHAPAPPPLNALMHRVAPQRAGGSRRRALAPRRWAPAMTQRSRRTRTSKWGSALLSFHEEMVLNICRTHTSVRGSSALALAPAPALSHTLPPARGSPYLVSLTEIAIVATNLFFFLAVV